jgi:hypothetical protein
MKFRAWLSGIVFLAAAAATLFSQDLVEAAKKERERRAAFRNKPVALLTDDAMSVVKKKPAVSVTLPQALPETEAVPPPAEGIPADESSAADRNVPTVSVIQPTEKAGEDRTPSPPGQASDSQSALEKAKEYADLLELKLNSLWLQFYSMDDGMPRELLQREIADVFEKYTKAREEEARLKQGAAPQRGDRN